MHRKIDGAGRAEIDADPAALAEDGINLELVVYSPEAAKIKAGAAGSAEIKIDNRLATAHEIGPPPDIRLHQQMQIRRIDIRIAEDAIFRQSGKGCGQTRLTRPSLAADDHYFTHGATLFLSWMIASIS